jgi:hypothetical protein
MTKMLPLSLRHCCVTACCGILIVTLTGCSWLTPAKKPEVGPAGKPEYKTNPPLVERFKSPPDQLYDLETTAGILFGGINSESWDQAQVGLQQLQTTWQEVSPQLGDEKNVKKANESLGKLATAVGGKKITASYEALNEFMGSISDIGQNFKLSPLSDIIGISTKVRNVSFFVEEKNWTKAASKVKELDDSWGAAKPSVESLGILGEVTRTHSFVKQLKDAVNAENKGAAESHIKSLNDSLGSIRDHYRGK